MWKCFQDFLTHIHNRQPRRRGRASQSAQAQIQHTCCFHRKSSWKQLHPFADQAPVNGHSQVTPVGRSPCRRPCDREDENSKSLALCRMNASLLLSFTAFNVFLRTIPLQLEAVLYVLSPLTASSTFALCGGRTPSHPALIMKMPNIAWCTNYPSRETYSTTLKNGQSLVVVHGRQFQKKSLHTDQ